MTDLSGDEWVVLLISAIGAVAFASRYARWLLCRRPLPQGQSRATIPFARLIASMSALAPIWMVLVRWSEVEVRSHGIYVVLFLLLGATWLHGVTCFMPLLGVRLFGDAIERHNCAAAVAAGGGLIGAAMCFAGANIGGGATIWSTILPAILATATWLAAWAAVEIASGVSEAIAIERDPASGWRLAGFLIATGLVLGRAVAGDYHSAGQTLSDFAREGWPIAIGVFVASLLQRWLRPTPARPFPPAGSSGVLPGAAIVLVAAVYVLALGWWEGKR